MPDKKKPGLFYGYVIVAAGILVSILLVGAYTSFSVFFKPMSSELGWIRATTSVAASLSALVVGLAGIATGRLTDKYGPKVVFITCGLFTGVGTLLMSQVNSLWQLYLYYGLLVGIGMTGCDIPVITTVARWFVRRRGMMVGITKVGAGIGIMLVPLLSSWLIVEYDWRRAYIITGLVLLVGVTALAFLFKRDPGQIGRLPDGVMETPVSTSTPDIRFSLREAMATRQFWTFSAMWFSFAFCMEVVMIHIVPHVTDLGFSETTGALVLSVIGGFSILGRFGLASLSDILGTKKVYIIAMALLALSLVCLLLAREPWTFYLFAALYGTAHGACFATLSPIIAGLFGVGSLGAILGIVLFIGTTGSLISPVLAGRIFDIIGNYQMAFWICLAFSIVGLLLIATLRPISRQGGPNGA